jgi:hypothetical protein
LSCLALPRLVPEAQREKRLKMPREVRGLFAQPNMIDDLSVKAQKKGCKRLTMALKKVISAGV